MSPDDPRHGKNAGYINGCRDTCCKTAHADYRRGLRTRRYVARSPMIVDSTGSKRRIKALVRLGWRLEDIDRKLGHDTSSHGCSWSHNVLRGGDIRVENAAAIRALYDELSMTLGPSQRSRTRAEKKGWAPPLAWDEDAIDDPSATPYLGTKKVHPHHEQTDLRHATLADLDRWGHGISEACRRLNTSRDALEAWSYRHGEAEVYSRLVDRENYAEKVNGSTAERRAG